MAFLIPDGLFLKSTFGKKNLAARAPGRNIVPIKTASRNRYPRLVRTNDTRRMETSQYAMISRRFIADTKLAKTPFPAHAKGEIGDLTFLSGVSAWAK